ncbi:TIGR02221 family CRISPR-associated protein, partial [Persephonella sp.]
MSKVFISTLGKGQYKESICILPDNTEIKTRLVSSALIDYIKPDEIYIIGTRESMWDLADELIGHYKRVVIPYGKRSEEFWEMFKIICAEVDVMGKDIYLDITHSFRSIPLMVSTVINLFNKVKGAKVKGLFYGVLYEEGKQDRTEVVDLLPILELNEWIEGFTLFKNYGDGDFLAELIEEKLSGLKPELRREAGDLKKLPKLLRKYSQAVGFTAVNFIPEFTGQVVQLINNIKSVPSDFNSVELLKASLNETYEEVKKEDAEEWKNQYKIVKWLFNKRRYSQATIALEECIFTYVLEKLG